MSHHNIGSCLEIFVEQEKQRSNLVRWLIAGLAVLAVATVAYGVTNEQNNLERNSRAALAAAGVELVDVRFEGRDATLIAAPDFPDRARAEAIVLAVEGVRAVVWDTPDQAGPATTSTTVTGATSTTDATTTIPTSTTNVPSTTSTTAVVATGPHLEAMLSEGRLTVSGVLPDEASTQRLAGVTNVIFAPFIDNQVTVDGSVGEASWVPNIASAVAALAIAGEAQLSIVNGVATLTGTTGTEEKKATVGGAIQAALGEATTVVNNILVTGQVPPSYHAIGSPDGTVTLAGVMPDQRAIDTIAGAAAQIYGPERIQNTMTVGENIEATFSVFRIPLTFTLLEPLTQWNIDIENDIISGAFLGGASFAVGSAQLTPELEALLDTAAGIILRNPTSVLVIEGHTDSRGPADENQALSERRAQAAVAYLVPKGIDPQRLIAIGYGETRPIATNDTAEGRASNRRVQFVFGPPQGG